MTGGRRRHGVRAGHDVHAQNAGDDRQQSREKGTPEEKRRGAPG
jgi:hypothetical protein